MKASNAFIQMETKALYPLGIIRSRDMPVIDDGSTLGQVDVRWLLAEELAFAVINSPDIPPKPLEHISVLDAIHNRISVLPIRFATHAVDEEEIYRLLLEQRQELMQCLDQVDGASEIGLRISSLASSGGYSEEPVRNPKDLKATRTAQTEVSTQDSKTDFQTNSDAELIAGITSATDYLASRRALYQREDQLNEQAHLTIDRYVSGLDGLYRQWRNLAATPPGVVRLAFLVERNRVGLFQDRLETLRDGKKGEKCKMLGPWPPYSFV